jgi:hypothetical protein
MLIEKGRNPFALIPKKDKLFGAASYNLIYITDRGAVRGDDAASNRSWSSFLAPKLGRILTARSGDNGII